VRVPYRRPTEALSHASVPFDVLIFADGETAPDRVEAEALSRYRTVVLPDCFDLTAHQVEALTACLDKGTVLVVTDRFAESATPEQRDLLRHHPGVHVGSAEDVATLTPYGPQVAASVPVAVNLHSLDGGVAIHLVNYDHDDDSDAVRRTGELELSVRLQSAGPVRQAVYRPADGPALEVPVRSEDDVHRVTLPDVGVYAVVELIGAGS